MPIEKSWMTLPFPCAQNHLLCWWRFPPAVWGSQLSEIHVRSTERSGFASMMTKALERNTFPGWYTETFFLRVPCARGTNLKYHQVPMSILLLEKSTHGSICLCGYLRIEDLVWLSSTSIWHGPKLPPNGWLIWDGFLLAVPYYYHRLSSSSLSLFVYTIPLALPYDSVDLNLNIRR